MSTCAPLKSPGRSGDSMKPVPSSAVDPSARGGLRAGQVVEVVWSETGGGSYPVRADRVTPRDDLQATPGA